MKMRITAERLRELFDYDKEAGALRRRFATRRSAIGDIAGSLNGNRYLAIAIDGYYYSIHRLVWMHVNGEFPAKELDHINRVRTDNRIENLREVTDEENSHNVSIRQRSNSGCIGVTWEKATNSWFVRIGVNKKSVSLGRFKQLDAAIAARKEAEAIYHPSKPGVRAMNKSPVQILRNALLELLPIVERGYAHEVIDEALALTAGAEADTAMAGSIDTPEFWLLLNQWRCAGAGMEYQRAGDNIIAHIDAHTRAAVAAAQRTASDAGENAPWLTLAHLICVDAGIAPGHITDRLTQLRDKLDGASDAGGAVAYLLPDDLAALKRFYECATDFDSGGHDVSRGAMSRLTEIGVCRHLGFGNHGTTSFGDYVLERDEGESSKLPLKTLQERNADAALPRKEAK